MDRNEYLRLYNQQEYAKESHRKSREKWSGEDEIRGLKEIPCADCKKRYPHYVMDFDHRGDKTFKVSDRKSKEERLVEAKKCDVVCSNCHRERTHSRRVKAVGTERFTGVQGRWNSNKTHCVAGHEFTEENTYYQKDGKSIKRRCRACNRAAMKKRRTNG